MLKPQLMIVALLLGIVLFGKRLPEVSRALGRALGELGRELRGLETELRQAATTDPAPAWRQASELPRQPEDPPV